MADQPSPRRRFQFRLRTLFVVLTIVAVQCAVCLPGLRQWQRMQRSVPRTYTRGAMRYTIRNVQFIGDENEGQQTGGFL
jgi:hypothetical protein